MKKYSWIVALLVALAFAFAACDDGDSSKKKDKDGDKDLPEVTVAGEAIVIKAIGGEASSIVIDKNTFAVNDVKSSSIGFVYEFPEEVKGKGYGSVIVELELLAITTPDFISFNAKDSTQMNKDVLIVGHAVTSTFPDSQYHNELKIGTITDKPLDAVCSKAGCLIYTPGTCIVGAKGSAEYPMSKLTNGVIAFQFNPYAGDITTPDWTSSSNATFKIAVTKITFPGGAAAEEEAKEEAKDDGSDGDYTPPAIPSGSIGLGAYTYGKGDGDADGAESQIKFTDIEAATTPTVAQLKAADTLTIVTQNAISGGLQIIYQTATAYSDWHSIDVLTGSAVVVAGLSTLSDDKKTLTVTLSGLKDYSSNFATASGIRIILAYYSGSTKAHSLGKVTAYITED